MSLGARPMAVLPTTLAWSSIPIEVNSWNIVAQSGAHQKSKAFKPLKRFSEISPEDCQTARTSTIGNASRNLSSCPSNDEESVISSSTCGRLLMAVGHWQSWTSARSRELQAVFMNFKNVSSGPEVWPKSSLKDAFRTSSNMQCKHAIHRSCRPRSFSRMVQHPLWMHMYMFDVVVSKSLAMIFSVVSRRCQGLSSLLLLQFFLYHLQSS